jgi:GNAT superfamily N-acetyltransferase
MKNEMEFIVKSGFDNMKFDEITAMLQGAFWSPRIKKSEVIQGSKNSALLVGAFLKEENQIGFARVISDKTRFAYILDVIVNEKYRKLGIGQAMINFILKNNELKDVYQWVLITKDAHGVYQKSGFKIISRPNDWMEIRLTRPNR